MSAQMKKMLAFCVFLALLFTPMDPPCSAKDFPNCGQESHTFV